MHLESREDLLCFQLECCVQYGWHCSEGHSDQSPPSHPWGCLLIPQCRHNWVADLITHRYAQLLTLYYKSGREWTIIFGYEQMGIPATEAINIDEEPMRRAKRTLLIGYPVMVFLNSRPTLLTIELMLKTATRVFCTTQTMICPQMPKYR